MISDKVIRWSDNHSPPVLQEPWPLLFVTLIIIACLKAISMWVVFPLTIEWGWVPSSLSAFVDQYHLIAQNLVEGHGYRVTPDTTETMFRTPGYVLFLAGLFSLFGKNVAAVKTANLLLSLATACIVFLLTRKITRNDRLSIVACIIVSLYPIQLLLEMRTGVECLFTFCLSLFMLFLYRALDRGTHKSFFLAGLAFGLVILVRTSPLLIVALLFIYLFFIYKRDNSLSGALMEASKKIGIFIVAMLIILSPWMMRNYSLIGTPAISESTLGMGTFHGYYITKSMGENKSYRESLLDAARLQSKIAASHGVMFKDVGFWDYFYSIEDEHRYSQTLFEYVVKEYWENPSLFIKHCLYNSIRFWFQGQTDKMTLLGVIETLPILVITFIGTYIGLKRQLRITPLLLIIAAVYLIHIPLISNARYHVPLMPFLVVLVSIGLSHRKLMGKWFKLDREQIYVNTDSISRDYAIAKA